MHDSSVEPDLSNLSTSPNLEVPEGFVTSPKGFSDALTLDLTDGEAQQFFQIVLPIISKYQRIFRSKLGPHVAFTADAAMKLIDQFEDEVKTVSAERMNLLVRVDAEPVFQGQSPVIDVVGVLPGHYSASFGFDHERKEWEVKRSKELGQDFLGADKLE